MAETTWTGWHFLGEDRKLQFHPHTLVEPGQTLHASGRLKLCENGLHASRRAIDALRYAPGPIVCRVELSGERLDGQDKSCARSRKCLWMADATRTLHEFALQCAEQVLTRAGVADQRPWHALAVKCLWHALAVKRLWLDGKATDAELESAAHACDAYAADAARAAYAAASVAEDQSQRLEDMLLALE